MQVYLITNKENGKLYVGQTVQSLHDRWQGHKCDANRYRGPLHLTHAFHKYGPEAFTMETLHECVSREEMDFVEMFYIAFLNTKSLLGYNLTDGGDGTKGTPVTEEQRRKISASLTGKKASEETKALLSKLRSGKGNSFFGKTHTPESLYKMRKARLGKKASPETRLAMSLAQGGWRHGTITAYRRRKCRCELCRKWRHDYHLKFKAKAIRRIKYAKS
jgi:group I intron endonuclease